MSNTDKQRLPPYDEAAERAVLGSILQEPSRCMYLCQHAGVTFETFYVPAHRTIYMAISLLCSRPKVTLDLVTLATALREADQFDAVGGTSALEKLIDDTPTSANIESYIAIIRDRELRRRAITIIRKSEADLFSPGTLCHDAIIDGLEAELSGLRINTSINITRLSDYKAEKLTQWRDAKDKGFVGVPTCFPELNKYLGGYRPGVMTILAGYRGEGKSSLLRQQCIWLAKEGYRVALFSLEDPGDIAAASIVGSHAGLSVFAFDTGMYADHNARLNQMASAWDSLANLPFWMVANSMSMDQIVATANLLRQRNMIDILAVDHLQLIQPYQLPRMTRNDTMAGYSQAIVGIAKRHNIPVLPTSQLSRDCEKESRKPRLSDLRDSGTLEQDARQVMILWKHTDEDFHRLEIEKNNFGVSHKTVRLWRLDGKQKFTDSHEEYLALQAEKTAGGGGPRGSYPQEQDNEE